METTPPHPDWLDRAAYPFAPHYFDTGEGRMHYIDEGQGRPIVMVHGTPTWSFLWRQLAGGLAGRYRVVAPDLLGFGLSDKPEAAAYRPEDHARRLRALVEALALEDVVLMVHDFGGPIGLSYAVDRPENVRALVLFNTWMWSRQADATTRRASRFLGGPVGRFLYRRLNVSPRVLLKAAFGDRARLTPAVHRHYLGPFPDPPSRQAPWVFARELVGSSAWYERLWAQRDHLTRKPALLLWGLKDPAFGEADLERWREALPQAEVLSFPDAGHFVQEEEPEAALRAVETFLARLS